MTAENAIFICYRRADSNPATFGLYERLTAEYGESAVFIDRVDFHAGDEWREKTAPILEAASAVVVVIHKDWVEIGKERLRDRNDPVRRELELALETDCQIIPVTIDDTPFPSDSGLASIADDDSELGTLLARLFAKTAIKVRFTQDFQLDSKALVRRLNEIPSIEPLGQTIRFDISGLTVMRPWTLKPRQPVYNPDRPGSELWILEAKYAAVPLIGREAEMAGLDRWLAADCAISVQLLTGRAGAGKTRLAFAIGGTPTLNCDSHVKQK